jgi:hypothetical protein
MNRSLYCCFFGIKQGKYSTRLLYLVFWFLKRLREIALRYMYIYKQRRGKEFGMFFKEGEVGEEQKKFFLFFKN